MTRLGHGTLLLIASVVLLTSVGCNSLSMPSMPFLDRFAFWDREVVPQEILSRHGPTASERLAQIDAIGRQAAKASPAEQQQIAENLARQISVEQDPQIRVHLIQAISTCHGPVPAAVLRAGLDDKELDVQLAACQALGDRRTPETTSVLGEIVGNDSDPLDLRLAAIDTLGQFNDPGVTDALAQALEARANPAMQFRAVKVLKKLTGLDYGDDLAAWQNHFARRSAVATAPPPSAVTPAPVNHVGTQSPAAQAGWRW